MNLKQLEVFIAVAESGSFSRAAEITYLTQSTVSQHVSSLEKEFELKLLDRTGKGALLTEGGKLLLAHARRVIMEAKEVPQALNRFRGLEEVVLKIAGSNIPACYMVPDCIVSFRKQYPGVIITLCQGDSREAVERLKRQEVEFAVVGARFEDKGLIHTPLVRDKISLVVPAGHPWSKKTYVSLEDLKQESLVFREPGSGTDRTLRDALAKAGLPSEHLKTAMCLGSNEAIKQVILNGAGISFVSELSVKKECDRGEVTIVGVRGVEIFRHFYLVTRQGRTLAPAAKAFIDCVLQRFRA